jgi:hypothetical protein
MVYKRVVHCTTAVLTLATMVHTIKQYSNVSSSSTSGTLPSSSALLLSPVLLVLLLSVLLSLCVGSCSMNAEYGAGLRLLSLL